MMQWNMQREVTVSKLRPGLTIKDFNFIQCIAFQDVWVMLWDIFVTPASKKEKGWEMEFKKKRRGVNLRITGMLSNMEMSQLMMLTCQIFKDSTSVFDVWFLYQSRQQGLKYLSSPLICCSSYFCTVFRQNEAGDVVILSLQAE